MNGPTGFSVTVHQNEYLLDSGEEVEAVLTVVNREEGHDAKPSVAQVIVIDCSGSMGMPPAKLDSATQATAAAIDTLREGVPFAVIAGTHKANVVYPHTPRLMPATADTREAAKETVRQLGADGGTAIGRWLALAHQLFAGHQDKICHTILLTDGKDEHETEEDLDAALATCSGAFSCDARGVGADWQPDELRKIATELLGTWDLVREPSELEADFRAMTQRAMRKTVADVMLRLWTPRGAVVPLIQQVEPTIEDLTRRRVESGTRTGDYPIGAWGSEDRAYHLLVRLAPGQVGEELLAARASVVAQGEHGGGTEKLAQGLVRAVWTDDPELASRMDPTVAHYTGQEELHRGIQQALQARDAGDMDTASSWFRKAIERGKELGRSDTVTLIRAMFDPATGVVRGKDDREGQRLDAIDLDRKSSKTTPLR